VELGTGISVFRLPDTFIGRGLTVEGLHHSAYLTKVSDPIAIAIILPRIGKQWTVVITGFNIATGTDYFKSLIRHVVAIGIDETFAGTILAGVMDGRIIAVIAIAPCFPVEDTAEQ